MTRIFCEKDHSIFFFIKKKNKNIYNKRPVVKNNIIVDETHVSL